MTPKSKTSLGAGYRLQGRAISVTSRVPDRTVQSSGEDTRVCHELNQLWTSHEGRASAAVCNKIANSRYWACASSAYTLHLLQQPPPVTWHGLLWRHALLTWPRCRKFLLVLLSAMYTYWCI